MAFNKLPTATLTSLPLQDAICLGGCSLIKQDAALQTSLFGCSHHSCRRKQFASNICLSEKPWPWSHLCRCGMPRVKYQWG